MWVVLGAAPPGPLALGSAHFAITNLETGTVLHFTGVAMDRFDIIKTPKVSCVFPELRMTTDHSLEPDIHPLVYDSPT